MSFSGSSFRYSEIQVQPPLKPRPPSPQLVSMLSKSAVGRGLTQSLAGITDQRESGSRHRDPERVLEDCGEVSVLKVELNPAFISV